MSTPSSKLRREVADTLFPGIGCADGACIYGHRGGMRTNGGCECLKGTSTDMRYHLMRLSAITKALADRIIDLENKDD